MQMKPLKPGPGREPNGKGWKMIPRKNDTVSSGNWAMNNVLCIWLGGGQKTSMNISENFDPRRTVGIIMKLDLLNRAEKSTTG